jgi:putative SOS response-associated peptidase YedK
MCGRYVLLVTGKMLAANYGLARRPDITQRYNIAPGQEVPAVRKGQDNETRELVYLKWGLIPFWAKEPKTGYKTINARAETVAKSPAFRAAFKHRRALIPADGFYEWKKINKTKQPYLIQRPDRENFAFAGLWEHWENEEGHMIESCAIITTESNDQIKQLHDRMPVILEPQDHELWLDPNTKPDKAQKILRPYEKELVMRPVSRKVNNPSNDDPSCIEEIEM